MKKRQEVVREPVQARSQQRVESILEACKTLIAKHGTAGLKMNDIAATAEVSIASIYQYYPNKQAIVAALATQYMDRFGGNVVSVLEESPDNLDALWKQILQLTDDYYLMHRDDSVVADILVGSANEKYVRDLIDEDSAKHLEFFFERTKHLFKPSQHEKIKPAIALIIDFTRVSVHRAVEMDEEGGMQRMEIAKKMLSNMWDGSIKPLARASKKS